MIKKKSLIFSFLVLIFFATACGSMVAQSEPTLASTTMAPAVPTLEDTPTPSPTATETPLPPTPTETSTPTTSPEVLQWLSFYVQFSEYSQISLEFNTQAGFYYGMGTATNGSSIDYTCTFRQAPSTELVCKGAPIPVGASVDFSLYDANSGSQVYRNTFTYRGAVPTPMGLTCEVEPQWNGDIPAHQLGQGCFALSCYLNGAFYYGNNNTCEKPWPFDWDFYHPLHPPRQ